MKKTSILSPLASPSTFGKKTDKRKNVPSFLFCYYCYFTLPCQENPCIAKAFSYTKISIYGAQGVSVRIIYALETEIGQSVKYLAKG